MTIAAAVSPTRMPIASTQRHAAEYHREHVAAARAKYEVGRSPKLLILSLSKSTSPSRLAVFGAESSEIRPADAATSLVDRR